MMPASTSTAHLFLELLVLILRQAGIEREALDRPATSNPRRNDELPRRIDVLQLLDVAEVLRRMPVGLLETYVVVLDDRIEEVREHGVGVSVRSVDAAPGVVVLETGLNAVEERGTEGGLLILESVEDLLGQVFLEKGGAVGGAEGLENECSDSIFEKTFTSVTIVQRI